MTAITICSDFGAQKIKSDTVSTVSPSISHQVMGPDANENLRCPFLPHISSFKVCFVLLCFLAVLRGMWDLSSAPRDRACAPCVGHTVLTTGPPGKSFQPQTSLLRTLPRISESGGSVEAGHLPFPASLTRCVVSRARLPRSCFVGPTPPSAFYSRDIWGVNAVLSLDAPATPRADLVIGGCNFPCPLSTHGPVGR